MLEPQWRGVLSGVHLGHLANFALVQWMTPSPEHEQHAQALIPPNFPSALRTFLVETPYPHFECARSLLIALMAFISSLDQPLPYLVIFLLPAIVFLDFVRGRVFTMYWFSPYL